MTSITIIGSGNMAAALAARAVKHGHIVEIMSRTAADSEALAARIGTGATAGAYGSRPAGDIVFLAVLYAGAVDVVAHYGDALAGKTIVEITNPFNADASGLATTEGNSVAQQIAAIAPADARVLKAFNMLFRGVLADDKPVDVFFAGGDSASRAAFSEFLESLDMRPRPAGGLEMTYVLEWAGILLMGLARNGAGFGTALSTESH